LHYVFSLNLIETSKKNKNGFMTELIGVKAQCNVFFNTGCIEQVFSRSPIAWEKIHIFELSFSRKMEKTAYVSR